MSETQTSLMIFNQLLSVLVQDLQCILLISTTVAVSTHFYNRMAKSYFLFCISVFVGAIPGGYLAELSGLYPMMGKSVLGLT